MDRALNWYESQGVVTGPFFRRPNGQRMQLTHCEEVIFEGLEHIQDQDNHVIRGSVNVRQDFGLKRSFRRGSDSQAINQGVSESDIDLNNRWRRYEEARGRRPSLRMQHSYADVRLILDALLRYLQAL